MTFEQYLTENCGVRILENLVDRGPEMERCSFPCRIWDRLTIEQDDCVDRDDCDRDPYCIPVYMNVERVYYRIKDLIIPVGNQQHEADAAGEGSYDDPSDLDFLILFEIVFAVMKNDEVDGYTDVRIRDRKYYAECKADIDGGALRNFRITTIFDGSMMTDLDIEIRRKQGEFSKYPVKALTNEELEARADAFLDRYCPEAKKVPMRVPVRTIFEKEFDLKLECDSDEHRFTMTREGCRRLWDSTALKLLDILVEKDDDSPFPEAMNKIMEKNAKRTAAGILMPAVTLRPVVWGFLGAYEEELKGEGAGDLLKNMVFNLAEEYKVSVQAMKIRLEDLGFTMFSGVLNHLDGEYVPAFTTSEGNPEKSGRYLIGTVQLKELLSERPELLKLCEEEKLVYVEGKLVMNQYEYVQEEAGERILTPYARTHVDECCIRFRGMSGYGRKPAATNAVIYELGRDRRFRESMWIGGTGGE